eukprot:TRINITY_DN36076_c0_g1_i1.p1 TRINITY_DN36076_c0_g1~~TRINITY_DN36076_c0_g1_i1.p1  ORF type:complete len:546 (-),score=85.81 TRINITY_DN36076_c0_g1_i1:492-2129(-)
MRTQWHALVAALFVASGCGFAYTFGTFSLALQEVYHLQQGDLDTIGIATLVVGFGTWTAGLLTDCWGPTASIVLGGSVNVLGWFLYGAIAVWKLPIPSPTLVFTTLGVLFTYGAACVTSAVFPIIVRNFAPQEGRGTAIGIAKSWVGVASGFATMVYIGFLPSAEKDPARLNYCFWVSALGAVFVLVPVPILHLTRNGKAENSAQNRAQGVVDRLCMPRPWRFRYVAAVTVLLIATTVAAASAKSAEASQSVIELFSVVLVVVALLPWLMLLPGRGVSARENEEGSSLTAAAQELESNEEARVSPWECGPWEMIQRPEAWLLWFCIFAIQSGGLILNVNLGPISDTRDGATVSAVVATSFFSAAQSFGRLTGGFVSDRIVKAKIARPWYLVALTFVMVMAHGCMVMTGPGAFLAGVLLAGYAFGSQYPVMILAIAELFGAKRISSNYMIYDGTPGAFAALFVAKYFATWVHDRHAGSDGKCHGDVCFQLAYFVVIGIELLAAACAALLAVRARSVYENSVFAQPARMQDQKGLETPGVAIAAGRA